MNIREIIDLGDLGRLRDLPDHTRYMYTMLLITIYHRSYDYSMHQYDDACWWSLFRIKDDIHVLPNPPEHNIQELLELLGEAATHPINSQDIQHVDMGGFSR